ncbi:hypothetical protein Cfor_09461, partial [Coptotermes formosanus]
WLSVPKTMVRTVVPVWGASSAKYQLDLHRNQGGVCGGPGRQVYHRGQVSDDSRMQPYGFI